MLRDPSQERVEDFIMAIQSYRGGQLTTQKVPDSRRHITQGEGDDSQSVKAGNPSEYRGAFG